MSDLPHTSPSPVTTDGSTASRPTPKHRPRYAALLGLLAILVAAYGLLLYSGKWAADRFISDLRTAQRIRIQGEFLDRELRQRKRIDVELREPAELAAAALFLGTARPRLNVAESIQRSVGIDILTFIRGSITIENDGTPHTVRFVSKWILPNNHAVVQIDGFDPLAIYDTLKRLGKVDEEPQN